MFRLILAYGAKWALKSLPPIALAFLAGVVCGAYGLYHFTHYREINGELVAAVAKAEQGAAEYRRLSALRDDYEKTIMDYDNLSAALARVQYAADRSRAAAASSRVDRARLNSCERLLREGASVSVEGATLFRSEDAKRKALARAVENGR